MRKFTKELAALCICVGLGALFAFLLNNFVLLNAQVITGSMEGTIMTQSRVLGVRSAFFLSPLTRGDIIVFDSPLPCQFPQPFVKRVIALPGEEIAIINGVVYINGTALQESYIMQAANQNFAPFIVPSGHFFVMGDNRDFSRDSREWGAICTNTVIGRIFLYN